MSKDERRAELDARLEESYAVFDGAILSEREQVEGSGNNGGYGGVGTGPNGTGNGDGSGTFGYGNESIIVASTSSAAGGPGYMPPPTNPREGDFDNSAVSYPVPEDIPSGNDDDVVARQLREAAMSEVDPELREKLWDEYRNYTGLSQ